MASATPSQWARIFERYQANHTEFDRREARVIDRENRLGRGVGPLLPPDEA